MGRDTGLAVATEQERTLTDRSSMRTRRRCRHADLGREVRDGVLGQIVDSAREAHPPEQDFSNPYRPCDLPPSRGSTATRRTLRRRLAHSSMTADAWSPATATGMPSPRRSGLSWNTGRPCLRTERTTRERERERGTPTTQSAVSTIRTYRQHSGRVNGETRATRSARRQLTKGSEPPGGVNGPSTFGSRPPGSAKLL